MKVLRIDPRLQQRLEEAELRLPEVDSELASPEVLSSPARLKELGRERARVDQIVTASRWTTQHHHSDEKQTEPGLQ